MIRKFRLVLGASLIAVSIFGCTPRLMATGDPVYAPRLERSDVVMSDGAHLPLRIWAAPEPHAVIVGLHGMNDYSNAFDMPGTWFAEHGITVYAYDQRGFGEAPGRGLWAGTARMDDDLDSVVALVKSQHPELPVYLLGESMGGGVAMSAFSASHPPQVDGVILAAPAVWGWRSMNAFYDTALWVSAHTVPYLEVTGSGLNIRPSDNIPMLRALGRDPMVIKETQIGTIYGLVNLMDDAAASASRINVPVLLMYGAHDEIVPPVPVADALTAMKRGHVTVTAACYPEGWHMLMRDLDRQVVWTDVAAWISDKRKPLPSRAENLTPCETLAAAGN